MLETIDRQSPIDGGMPIRLFALILCLAQAVVAEGPRVGALLGGTPYDFERFQGAFIVWRESSGRISFCSGTLVGPRTILTAAHCIAAVPPTSYRVFVGGSLRTDIKTLSAHPDFDDALPPSHKGNLASDVGIITLASPVVGVAPLPLLTDASIAVGSRGIVLGFGLNESPYNAGTERLDPPGQFGIITVEDSNPFYILSRHRTSGVSLCPGDSGGPLVFSLSGRPAIAGVASASTNVATESVCMTPQNPSDSFSLHTNAVGRTAATFLDRFSEIQFLSGRRIAINRLLSQLVKDLSEFAEGVRAGNVVGLSIIQTNILALAKESDAVRQRKQLTRAARLLTDLQNLSPITRQKRINAARRLLSAAQQNPLLPASRL